MLSLEGTGSSLEGIVLTLEGTSLHMCHSTTHCTAHCTAQCTAHCSRCCTAQLGQAVFTTLTREVMQSLSSELESKGADLEALQDRCHSKDEQVAALGQQVEQLESSVEAQKQANSTKQQHSPYEWAVDVSLDQGVGPGPPRMLPSSPTALRQRVQTLEVSRVDALACAC